MQRKKEAIKDEQQEQDFPDNDAVIAGVDFSDCAERRLFIAGKKNALSIILRIRKNSV